MTRKIHFRLSVDFFLFLPGTNLVLGAFDDCPVSDKTTLLLGVGDDRKFVQTNTFLASAGWPLLNSELILYNHYNPNKLRGSVAEGSECRGLARLQTRAPFLKRWQALTQSSQTFSKAFFSKNMQEELIKHSSTLTPRFNHDYPK